MNDELFLNERIKVLAVFDSGLNCCKPIKFKKPNGQEIKISEIGLRHPTTKGKRMIHIFDLTDGMADYRLEFDAERLVWFLTRESDHV